MKTKRAPLLLALASGMVLTVAFDVGKSAYTKRYETGLLKEPQAMAEAVGKLAFATEVKVDELSGKWAKVTANKTNHGWIYLGNLVVEKPHKVEGTDGLQTGADKTTANVAARPLGEVTTAYCQQSNLADALADMKWLEAQSDTVSNAVVVTYLKASKRGEYQ